MSQSVKFALHLVAQRLEYLCATLVDQVRFLNQSQILRAAVTFHLEDNINLIKPIGEDGLNSTEKDLQLSRIYEATTI